MKRGMLIVMLLLVFGQVFAVDPKTEIDRANKAYAVGSYSTAADLYLKVVSAGFESPGLYYNLGNACYKMGEYPRSILWYERARRLDPGNEDILYNLNVANTKISDKIEPIPDLFYKKWYRAMVQMLPTDTYAILALSAWIAGLGFLVMFVVSRVLVIRKIGLWSGLGLLLAGFLFLAMAWSGYSSFRSESEAIVFAPTINVKSSPDDKSTDLFVLHEGTKVRLLDQISGWYEIRIANGSVGWLPASSLEKI